MVRIHSPLLKINRRPPGLKTGKAFEGFLQFKTAAGLSPRTVETYRHDPDLWHEHAGEIALGRIKSADISRYLTYLRTEYTPPDHRAQRDKTICQDYPQPLGEPSAFFNWAASEFGVADPMDRVPAPKAVDTPVEPFTQADLEALLKACDFSKEANTNRRHKFTMRRPSGYRDN